MRMGTQQPININPSKDTHKMNLRNNRRDVNLKVRGATSFILHILSHLHLHHYKVSSLYSKR